MPGVTISSAYGAGGQVIAPRVAEALGFRLVDRAINAEVARKLHISLDEAERGERKQSFADRFFCSLAPLADAVGGDPELASGQGQSAEDFRTETATLLDTALAGGAVVLGRGGAAAIADSHPDVLRVRLYGDPDRRVAAAVKYYDSDERTARENMHRTDAARAKYVQHLYGRDVDDADLYHLQIDTPRFELDQCIEVIVAAYRAFTAAASQSEQTAG